MLVKIEPLQTNDWSEFYSCFQEILSSDFKQYSSETKRILLERIFSEKKLLKNFQKGKKKILVAKLNKQVIGFLIYVFGVGGISYINWLGVEKEFRGQGVGRQLIEAWEGEALGQKIHKLAISTSDEENHDFYQKLGFEPEGVRKKHRWRLDTYLFGKILSPRLSGRR